jgi:hypothetical protein
MKRPAEARQAAEEAQSLLPPPEKRTSDEKQIAIDLNWELRKDRSAEATAPSSPHHPTANAPH